MRPYVWLTITIALFASSLTACTLGRPIDPCGNGTCDDDEDANVCAADCVAVCGNAVCESGETGANCSLDCSPSCGDGLCDLGENCAADCGVVGPVCGDGFCDPGETDTSCPSDCPVGPVCGDGVCDATENSTSCPADCAPFCGNGLCETGEDSHSCPSDCSSPVCGDGWCDPGEDQWSCPSDCGGGGACGDGWCDPCEDSWSCPLDCFCGDGFCDIFEDPTTCPSDCGGGGWCGDGWCDAWEDPSTCPTDCGGGGWCGDGWCDAWEDPFSCPTDCGSVGVCGDGICDAGETVAGCSADCSAVGGPCTADTDCVSAPGLVPACLDASTGFPGGYCSNIGCTPGGSDCPVGANCDLFSDGMGGTIGVCLAGCIPSTTGAGCRSDVDGDFAYGCRPDLIDPLVGSCYQGCETDQGCNTCDTVSGFCDNDDDFPCATDADCMLAPVLQACETTVNLCYPNHPAGSADIGDPCTDDADCPSNAECFGADGTSMTYPAGYCTSLWCDSLGALPEFACAGAGVCPSADGFLGGMIQLCTAPCTLDVTDPDGECDMNRGDDLDYVCHETSNVTVSLTELFDTNGAAGFCFQCEGLFGPGTPECP